MPELPEVESTRRSIEPHVVERRIVRVDRGPHADAAVHGPSDDASLLVGRRIACIARQGKELAIIAQPADARTQPLTTDEGALCLGMSSTLSNVGDDSEPEAGGLVIVVHLGMSGSLRHGVVGAAAGDEPRSYPQAATVMGEPDRHTHITWHLDDGSLMAFRDPRRFGGLTPVSTIGDLWDRWAQRGPDALRITAAQLRGRLAVTARPIKAALLDQNVVAGLGNIYVDELLFLTRIHPLTPARSLGGRATSSLAGRMGSLLRSSIKSGGSSLRDYVNAQGESGGFQKKHKVYGRSGGRCGRCRADLETLLVAGRTTVCCPSCQPRA